MGLLKRAIARTFGITAGDLSPAYEAASHGRRLKTWRAPNVGPNAALQFNLESLRNRSRDQVRQNAYAARASDAFVNNVVGTGIRALSRADDERLRDQIQELWGRSVTELDAAGVLDFHGLEAQIARAWYEGGECFIRRRARRPADGLAVPMQLQVLESEHVPADMNEIARSGNPIRYGIEFDRIGRRVAYHMHRTHPGDVTGLDVLTRSEPDFGQTVRVPAEEVLHVFLPRRPGQQRGEPWLTRALVKLRDLDAYDDAELQRKKNATMLLGVIKRTGEALPMLGDEDSEAEAAEESDETAVQTMEPSTLIALEDGEDVSFNNPPDLDGQYEVFIRQQLRAVAQASAVLYEQLTGDYSQVNDRTYRAAFNDLRRQIEGLQQHVLIPQVCRPVWRWWFDAAVLSGALPRRADTRANRRVQWVPQGFRHLHPEQDMRAETGWRRGGYKSRAQQIAELGRDPQDVECEITQEDARADAAGLVFDSDPRKVSRAGGAQGDDAFDDDAEPRGRPNGAAVLNGGSENAGH